MRYGLWIMFLAVFAMTFGGSLVEAFMEIYGLVILFVLALVGVCYIKFYSFHVLPLFN